MAICFANAKVYSRLGEFGPLNAIESNFEGSAIKINLDAKPDRAITEKEERRRKKILHDFSILVERDQALIERLIEEMSPNRESWRNISFG